VILPERNIKDLIDIPRKVKTDLKIIPVSHMDEVLLVALHPAKPSLKKPRGKKKITKPVVIKTE
jgi:ATP-dependent Lon protease